MEKFLTFILSSNFGQGTHYYEVSGSSQYLQASAGMILNYVTTASFQMPPIHYSLIIILFYAIRLESELQTTWTYKLQDYINKWNRVQNTVNIEVKFIGEHAYFTNSEIHKTWVQELHVPSKYLSLRRCHIRSRSPGGLLCWSFTQLLLAMTGKAALYFIFLNWYSGGWSTIGSTRYCGHQ
jgi:hypothetical protein